MTTPAASDETLAQHGVQVAPGARLARYSTFQLGGGCRAVWHCRNPAELQVAVNQLAAGGRPWVLLGEGSNVLIADDGFPGVVVRYLDPCREMALQGPEVEVPGSALLDAVAEAAARQGWDGLICCTGIPGTLGGAVVGNAGAWGEQIADRLVSVRLLRRDGTVADADPSELGFGYRCSALQPSGDLVLSVRLRLQPGSPQQLVARRQEILRIRAAKHPDWRIQPCIGSIFRNVEPTSAAGRRQAAGWFLERAGAKSMRIGGAYIFPKHANIVVKGPGCTARHVYQLIAGMAEAVDRTFGLRLVREVRFLGRFEDPPQATPPGFH